MTGKTEEQLRKELRYFTEQKRSFDQIITIIHELVWVLIRVTISYCIFSLAMLGTKVVFVYPWLQLASVLVFACASMWMVTEVAFTQLYKPIRKDAAKGMELIYSKTKCAVEAWRNTK